MKNKEFSEERTSGGASSRYISQAVEDAQLLVSYVAHEGLFELEGEPLDVMIRSKYLHGGESWTHEDEVRFWLAYDKIITRIKPVTIESLKSTLPVYDKSRVLFMRNGHTKASQAVNRYRFLAVLSMVVVLVTQIYWVVGSDLNRNLASIFKEREKVRFELEKLQNIKGEAPRGNGSADLTKIASSLEVLNQKLDANYELLCGWNRVWQFVIRKEQFQGKVTPYVKYKYELKLKEIESRRSMEVASRETGPSGVFNKRLEMEKLNHALDLARNRLFLTELSAEYVLRALQVYLLPLLYGFLGATTFVLRTLSYEIKNLTYTHDSEIRFRLRISLGGLAGMAVGWFLKPDEMTFISSLSPLAIAFVVGYNVDVLFSLMDRVIESVNGLNHPSAAPGEIKSK